MSNGFIRHVLAGVLQGSYWLFMAFYGCIWLFMDSDHD